MGSLFEVTYACAKRFLSRTVSGSLSRSLSVRLISVNCTLSTSEYKVIYGTRRVPTTLTRNAINEGGCSVQLARGYVRAASRQTR